MARYQVFDADQAGEGAADLLAALEEDDETATVTSETDSAGWLVTTVETPDDPDDDGTMPEHAEEDGLVPGPATRIRARLFRSAGDGYTIPPGTVYKLAGQTSRFDGNPATIIQADVDEDGWVVATLEVPDVSFGLSGTYLVD